MIKSQQSGQILLIVVLTMIIALTVGLSIAARVVTELKLSKQNEESQRAFQAAEAGIQKSLQLNTSVGLVPLDNNSSFSTELATDIGTGILVNNGQEVDQATGADVWLSDYPTFANPIGGAMYVYWGSSSQSNCSSTGGDSVAPALEVVVLQGNISSPTVIKNIFEATPCGSSRISNATLGTQNGVSTWSFKGMNFLYRAPLTFNGSNISGGLLMKAIPIFNSSIVGFQTNGTGINFPAQGSVVTSTGTSGDTVRKIIYFQSYPQLPLEVFPYSLISQ